MQIARLEKFNALIKNICNSKFYELSRPKIFTLGKISIRFGHFNPKNFLREYFLMSWAMLLQYPKTKLIRHIYKKRTRFTVYLGCSMTNAGAIWFNLDRLVFIMSGYEGLKTLKVRRYAKNKQVGDLKLFYNFRFWDTRLFSTPKFENLSYNTKLPISIGIRFIKADGLTTFVSPNHSEAYLRLLRFPINFYKMYKIRSNDDRYKFLF